MFGLGPIELIGAIGTVAAAAFSLWRLGRMINDAIFDRMEIMLVEHVAPAIKSATEAAASASRAEVETHKMSTTQHTLLIDVATLKGWTQGFTARTGAPSPFGSDTPAYPHD